MPETHSVGELYSPIFVAPWMLKRLWCKYGSRGEPADLYIAEYVHPSRATRMIVNFGLHLDGQRGWRPANRLGEVTVGPAGLLGILELQLGLSRESSSAAERVVQFRDCLKRTDVLPLGSGALAGESITRSTRSVTSADVDLSDVSRSR